MVSAGGRSLSCGVEIRFAMSTLYPPLCLKVGDPSESHVVEAMNIRLAIGKSSKWRMT